MSEANVERFWYLFTHQGLWEKIMRRGATE